MIKIKQQLESSTQVNYHLLGHYDDENASLKYSSVLILSRFILKVVIFNITQIVLYSLYIN